MSKLYQLIQSEYKFEYITEYVKPEGLMDKKNFSTPQIYPKIISQKHLNAFSELEKQQILDKYKRWYFTYTNYSIYNAKAYNNFVLHKFFITILLVDYLQNVGNFFHIFFRFYPLKQTR